jgi:dipeptidyl aminopeptidase/acylaminoacyl peptidase
MTRKSFVPVWKIFVLTAVVLSLAAGAGTAPAQKRPLSYDAYDGWMSIRAAQLTRDGQWLAYALVPGEGDGELVVRNLRTDREFRSPRGNQPAITFDGKFVVFTIAPPKADVDKAKKEKKKPEEQPKTALGIMNLSTGEVTTVERIKNFKVAEEGGAFVAYLLEPPIKKPEEKREAEKKEEVKKEPAAKPEAKTEEAKPEEKKEEKKKEPGNDLVVRELATGKETKIPEVTEYAWNKDGSWLAYAVSSKTPENDGAFAWEAASGKTTDLLKGLGHYKNMTFDKKGGQLAFVSDRDDYKADKPAFKLYHWAPQAAAAVELASGSTKGFPEGMAVSENGDLSFSEDGNRLFFGIAATPKPEPKDAPEPIKVDIWNWKDPLLQPMQKVQADRERRRTLMCVIHLMTKDKKFAQLGTEDVPEIRPGDHTRLALGLSDIPYRQLISWDRGYDDVYLVSLADGAKMKVLEKSAYGASFSPGGNYLLYFNDEEDDWYTYRISDGKRTNVTAKIEVPLVDETHDSPDEPRPYGTAGWTEGDRAVLVYDRYDIWEVSPDGSKARMVTEGIGRKDKLVFRYQRLDRDEKTVPDKTPILLATTDDSTKASGVYRVTIAQTAAPAKVVMLDKLLRISDKAKDADLYLFTAQRFEEYPNLWVSDGTFANPRKVSDANPQQSEYVWGKAELIEYTNGDGVPLPAILIKPDNFDPAKKYPLMVYIYETLAGGLHRFVSPGPGTSINVARYVSNGYVVLQPDIIYEVGYPGPSCLKCVVPAVEKVLDMGFIDPKRVGIQGHSWGGYQISYLITQTNIFAAVQAGASVVNMTSAYGGIRWGSGMSRAFQYEKTQSRIGDPLWDGFLRYIENSPLFWAEKVQTPYLTIHNDEDDAVPWYQGIEFFTALRRLGKEAYLFNYNTEKHGLRQRENQKHWTIHQDEFFDHFLLGKPKPEWMEKGVAYLERGKRDIDAFYKKPEAKTGEEKK